MKSAEEVAKELKDTLVDWHNECWVDGARKRIAAALTDMEKQGYAAGLKAQFEVQRIRERQARVEALEEAAKVCSETITPSTCRDSHHDPRWCSTCEAQIDAADCIETAIRALAQKEK